MMIWIGHVRKRLKAAFLNLLYGTANIRLAHRPPGPIGVHQMNFRNFYSDIRKLAYLSYLLNKPEIITVVMHFDKSKLFNLI